MNIELKEVNYSYNKGLVNEVNALKDINLKIDKPEFIALIGSTGSGKSTLIQMFNGLIKLESGSIYFDGVNIYDKLSLENENKKEKEKKINEKKALSDLRRKVGLVFQYPENQLFEETIIKDVMFGPKNLGLSDDEAKQRAIWALNKTGIKEEFFEKSPFDLSGGEMRRVAIAGVLAMKPDVLVLDEPTAGLDPQGRISILKSLKEIQEENSKTIILVSHTMEEVAEFADRIVAMHEGKIIMDGTPHEIFKETERLNLCGLKKPEITEFLEKLSIDDVITLDEAVEKILERINKKKSI